MSTIKRIRHVRIQGLVPRCDLQSLEHREVELKRDNTMALLCWHRPIILRASELRPHLYKLSCCLWPSLGCLVLGEGDALYYGKLISS